ncbi:MAG: domain S-box protein [Actinomycetia bacterium]|nr:domain S-box protein [Actinomycetes bacterium]
MSLVLERGAGGTRRAHPVVAITLGIWLPVLAALAADVVWDGRYLLIPATWLLVSVVVAALLGGRPAGLVASVMATFIDAWNFVPPEHTLRMRRGADVVAVVAFVVLAFGITAALDQVMRARGRADRTLESLDALLQHAPIGVAFLDRELRFVRANQAMASIAGRTLDEHMGRTLDEVIDRPELSAIARGVLDTGVPVLEVEIGGTTQLGRPFNALAGYYPVRGKDGSIEGVGVVVREVTAAVEAERERVYLVERLTRLQRITGALAAARTTADVVRVVLEDVREATIADAASLCTVVDGEVQVVGTTGHAPEVLAAWDRFPVEAGTPFAEAVLTGELVVARSYEELVTRWPLTAASVAPTRQALVAIPLLAAGEVTGTIGLSFDRPLESDPGVEAFLVALGRQCAEAFLRAQLHESEAAAGVRLAFLAEASDALASSLEWTETLRRVTELAVPRLADFAAVFVVDGENITALEMAEGDPARETAVRRIAARWPGTLDRNIGMGAVARTGRPLLANDITLEQIQRFARDQEHATALVEAGYSSILAVPMRAHEAVVGVIALASRAPRRLNDDDLALATELATRAGQAVLNAELFRDRSLVAATLQASLLPPATPTVPGLEIATRFFAVGAGIDVGGDFYDVFRMGTAAEPADRWAVVIGDVRGKGTEAASISGAARHAIRVAALHEQSPAAILRRLNELLLAMADEDELDPRFCTAVVAVVEPLESGARIVLAIGGHPPPLVLRADGTTEAIGSPGSLIGVVAEPDVSDVTIELATGDALVLYTDGVTERHAGDRFFDEEGLASVLSRCTGFTAPVLAERIETASRAFVEDAPRDDLAIVVVRAPERGATATTAGADLPADVGAPTFGRRFVVAALAALGLDQHAEIAALLASELVTNALVHATGPFRISVEPLDGAVRIVVTDGSEQEPVVQAPDTERPGGRGVYLVDALASRWGVQRMTGGKAVWFELDT